MNRYVSEEGVLWHEDGEHVISLQERISEPGVYSAHIRDNHGKAWFDFTSLEQLERFANDLNAYIAIQKTL